ncbi:hypothetical protein AMTR_s00088p00145250 [Amborella trichopoda]|uniref:Uncharacterized protein n=1 Tax=Amborella trichopoda TaxID=13333 RepID=W1NWD9_AMBTC|nr:hypothetical protein AMTR_s00088p00145250 [Amborella trichopoda]
MVNQESILDEVSRLPVKPQFLAPARILEKGFFDFIRYPRNSKPGVLASPSLVAVSVVESNVNRMPEEVPILDDHLLQQCGRLKGPAVAKKASRCRFDPLLIDPFGHSGGHPIEPLMALEDNQGSLLLLEEQVQDNAVVDPVEPLMALEETQGAIPILEDEVQAGVVHDSNMVLDGEPEDNMALVLAQELLCDMGMDSLPLSMVMTKIRKIRKFKEVNG